MPYPRNVCVVHNNTVFELIPIIELQKNTYSKLAKTFFLYILVLSYEEKQETLLKVWLGIAFMSKVWEKCALKLRTLLSASHCYTYRMPHLSVCCDNFSMFSYLSRAYDIGFAAFKTRRFKHQTSNVAE